MIDKLRSCIDSVPAAIRSALLLAVMIATSIGLCLVFATPQDDPAERGEVIELPVADYSSAFFGLYAETLAETDGPMTLEDVIASDGWETMGTRYMSFGSVSDTIWIRARVRNISDAPITIRFDTRRVAFDHMDMYLTDPDGSGSTQFLDYSYAAPFSDRPVNHRFLVADIELAPNETQMAYVRFRGLFNTILPLRLASPEAFQMAEKHEVFWSAQFYGTFTAITFLTLLAAPLIGWRTSLSFGFFLITSAATCLAVEGYIDQHLIPDKNEITARLTDSLYFLTAAAILILSRTVFDLQAKARLLDSVLGWTSYTILLIGTFHFLFGIAPRTVFIPIFLLLRGTSLILHAVVGIWAVWTREKGGTAFAASSILVATASIALVVDPTFGYPYGGYPFIMRWLVTVEAMALAIAIVQSVLGLRKERDLAIKADLVATRERLRLSLALADSQKAYSRAQRAAGQYMRRLQTVSHDILQPLQSLKSTLREKPSITDEQAERLQEAFDYLEALARQNLQSHHDHTRVAAQAQSSGSDNIPIATVISTVATMFANDAAAKGVELLIHSADETTSVPHPVLLMRAISNLVSNSLQHATGNRIDISFDCDQTGTWVSVRDQGPGMSADALRDMLDFGNRGAVSHGSGFGLAIVQDAAREMGAELEIHSTESGGTTAKLSFINSPNR